jgi:hypothetical protein
MHTYIHALSGIGTHDLSVRASEDSSGLRPRDHHDRLVRSLSWYFMLSVFNVYVLPLEIWLVGEYKR